MLIWTPIILALWLVVYVGALAVRRTDADAAARHAITDAEPPAIVDLIAHRGRLTDATYPATILNLAARGYLRMSRRDGVLWCEPAPEPPPKARLTGFERRVLDQIGHRLAGVDGAPFEALAGVEKSWRAGFEREIRAEARRRGLTRDRLPGGLRVLLRLGAVPVGVLLFAGLDALPHAPLGWTLAAGAAAYAVLAGGLVSATKRDQAAPLNAAEAAYRDVELPPPSAEPGQGPELPTDSEALTRAAYGAAAGAHLPELAAFRDLPRPTAAWSSFGGSWRLVTIGAAGAPLRRQAGVFATLTIWLGLIGFGLSFVSGTASVVAFVIAGAVFVLTVRAVAERAALPKTAEFDGQVIAIWQVSGAEGTSTTYTAVDDGRRAWVFDLGARRRPAIGDLVHIRAAPRTMKLRELTPFERPAPVAALVATTPGRLLTEEEVTRALGTPMRTTEFGDALIFRGDGVTLSLTVGNGMLGERLARRFGRPLAGLGDEAWVLNKGRTVMARLGARVMKLTVNDTGREATLTSLAQTVIARIAEPYGSSGGSAGE